MTMSKVIILQCLMTVKAVTNSITTNFVMNISNAIILTGIYTVKGLTRYNNCDGSDDLSNRELHVDTAKDEVWPGLAVEGGLTLIVTHDNSLNTSKFRKSPVDVLEVDLSSPKGAATVAGSKGIRIAKTTAVGIRES